MLRKVYLSTTLPETRQISPKTNPDLVQKLSAYRREKQAYTADAPPLRPNPMEKYDRKPLDEMMDMEERDAQIIFNRGEEGGGDEGDDAKIMENRYGAIINTLPIAFRRRATRLLPYLLDKDIGDLNIGSVLYDLTVPNVKKIRSNNFATLRSLYRQLDTDMSLPKSYYVKKQLPNSPGGSSSHSVSHSMLKAPPGRRNTPTKAATPRSTPAPPVFHTKASSKGGTAKGDEMVTSTPFSTSTPYLTPLFGTLEDVGESTTPTSKRHFTGGRGKGLQTKAVTNNSWI